MNNNSDIFVSIYCLTYNHCKYIRDALDGFLIQKTNFKYKVFIYDDASTDGTSDILREYQEKYPEIFDIYISKKNTFKSPDRNQFLLSLCREKLVGKYVALCEGDDFWIDSNKLQRQVDYMEQHLDCALCMHNAVWFDCRENVMEVKEPYDIAYGGSIIDAKEIIMMSRVHPPTASIMFRRDIWDCDDFFFLAPVGDYPLLLAALTKGYIFFDDRVMSVYRWMTSGSYNSKMMHENTLKTYYNWGMIKFLQYYNEYTSYNYDLYVRNKIQFFICGLIDVLEKEIDVRAAITKCQNKGYKLEVDNELLYKIESLAKVVHDKSYIPNNLENYLKNNGIWIMGAGKYSRVLGEKLEHNGINFFGYVVSDLKGNPSFIQNKPVCLLNKEIVGDNGIIVGILSRSRNEIELFLREVGIVNYCFPYDIEIR